MSRDRRKGMVAREHPGLSISRQCELLQISRSSLYYEARGDSALNLGLMRLIDELYLQAPCYGARQMTRHLRRLGYGVNRKRIRRLMQRMGLVAIYPRRSSSAPHPDHEIYPYLLRDVEIDRTDQVWSSDITYIPMRRGFLYLVVVMDWHSRMVLSWRLSNSLDAEFCVTALKEALMRYGKPEVFNTDQGSQFTSSEFTDVLKESGVAISMDGKGTWMDNVMIERLWWSLKYECIYLNAFETGSQARNGIGTWIARYNEERPHSSLDDKTPHEAYWGLPRAGYSAQQTAV